MPRNYFSQGAASEIIGAGNDAFDRQTALYDDVNARYTATRAGRRMAQGDRMGASREFANAGLLDEARVLESDQVAADTRMRQDREREAAAAKAKRDEEAAAKKARAEAMVKILGHLGKINPPENDPRVREITETTGVSYQAALGVIRASEFKRALPILGSLGTPPEALQQLQGLGEGDFTDQALLSATGEAQKMYDQYFNTSAGVVGVKQRTGEAALIYDAPDKPIILGPERDAYDRDGNLIVKGRNKVFAPPGRGRGGSDLPPPPGRWRAVGAQ